MTLFARYNNESVFTMNTIFLIRKAIKAHFFWNEKEERCYFYTKGQPGKAAAPF